MDEQSKCEMCEEYHPSETVLEIRSEEGCGFMCSDCRRDVADRMGICAVDGCFRYGCVKVKFLGQPDHRPNAKLCLEHKDMNMMTARFEVRNSSKSN